MATKKTEDAKKVVAKKATVESVVAKAEAVKKAEAAKEVKAAVKAEPVKAEVKEEKKPAAKKPRRHQIACWQTLCQTIQSRLPQIYLRTCYVVNYKHTNHGCSVCLLQHDRYFKGITLVRELDRSIVPGNNLPDNTNTSAVVFCIRLRCMELILHNGDLRSFGIFNSDKEVTPSIQYRYMYESFIFPICILHRG